MALFKELVDLFITFFKIGIVTFGGGLTMLPLLERVLINEKNWVSMDEILDYYSVAQTTPGIIAVNVATFVGHKRAGTIGDMRLAGGYLNAKVTAFKPGHTINTNTAKAVRALLAKMK